MCLSGYSKGQVRVDADVESGRIDMRQDWTIVDGNLGFARDGQTGVSSMRE